MKNELRPVGLFSLMLTLALSASPGPVFSADDAGVSPWVVEATAAGQTTEILVVLAEQSELGVISSGLGRSERRHLVRDTLWETAQRSQQGLRRWLDARELRYRSFYIVNAILVHGADASIVETLAMRPEVDRVEANPRIWQPLPQLADWPEPKSTAAIEWNILTVRADED